MGNSNNAGFPSQTRQMGSGVSFAQSLGGSQPAAPLDMSYVLSIRLQNRPYISHRNDVLCLATSTNSGTFKTLRIRLV